MSLYGGNWDEYRANMCICPKCGRDEITHCVCDEDAEVCGIKDITCDENMTNDELDD